MNRFDLFSPGKGAGLFLASASAIRAALAEAAISNGMLALLLSPAGGVERAKGE